MISKPYCDERLRVGLGEHVPKIWQLEISWKIIDYVDLLY